MSVPLHQSKASLQRKLSPEKFSMLSRQTELRNKAEANVKHKEFKYEYERMIVIGDIKDSKMNEVMWIPLGL